MHCKHKKSLCLLIYITWTAGEAAVIHSTGNWGEPVPLDTWHPAFYQLKHKLGELEAEQRFLAVQACKNMVLSVVMQQTSPPPKAPGAKCNNSAVNQTHQPPLFPPTTQRS